MRSALSTLILIPFAAGLLSAQAAFVQVVHNCADAAAATVDLYVNGEIAVDDLSFRSATPFIDLPLTVTIAIAPSTSVSASEAFFTKEYSLADGENYLLVASGVISPDNYAPNSDPEAKPIAFDLLSVAQARLGGSTETDVDVLFVQGVTDAPKFDVMADLEVLVEGLSYGEASPYLILPPAAYTINLAPSGGAPLLSFSADLTTLGGQAVTVLASGFFIPATNQNGPAAGLFAISRDGGPFLPLPQVPTQQTAKVQLIHNAADPLAALVDVYVDGKLAADNFAFRTATPFVTVLANTDVEVAVAPPTSQSVDDAMAAFPLNVPPGRYVVVANGVLTPATFAPNPDPRAPATGFMTYPVDGIRPGSSNPGEADVIVFHGSTDAPAVDVTANGQMPLVSDLVYGEASEYISLPAISYTVNVAPAGSGTPVANFRANLSGLAGQSVIVVASGFLDPAKNHDGPAFGLWAALSDGGALIELPPVTSSVNEPAASARITVTPNPASSGSQFSVHTNFGAASSVMVTDLVGNIVIPSGSPLMTQDGDRRVIRTSGLATGIYMVTVIDGPSTVTVPVTVMD